jgi:NAD(P)-dependent dehydrogenase (short-subunit alcohol dehydrogenase family)
MTGDMTGRIAVVTGATSGIGRETARILAARGARVLGVGRDPARSAAAESEIRASAGSANVRVLVADLSSLCEVRSLAERIGEEADRVDVLVNNAGTFTFARTETVDGVETQLAVNWLAGYALTGLLLPLLRAAPSARVVTVSSGSHFSGRIHWQDPGLARGYSGLKAYDQSKLATVLFSAQLARRLDRGAAVWTYAVDPGLVKTDIGLKGNGALVRAVWRLRTRGGISARAAAESVCFCAAHAAAEGRTGLYWKECSSLSPSPAAQSERDGSRLWELGARLSGVFYP